MVGKAGFLFPPWISLESPRAVKLRFLQLMSSPAKSRFPRNSTIAFAVVFCVLYWPGMFFIPSDGPFRRIEDSWQDHLFTLRENAVAKGDPRIIIAAMDADTGKKYGFPLPRAVQAKLIDKLGGYGVKTVAFDVMFLDPRDGDAELVAATKRFKRAIHLFVTEAKETSRGQVTSVSMPIPGLARASQYLGYPNVDAVIDGDGHVRRAMLFNPTVSNPIHQDQAAPTLDAVTYASFVGSPLSEVHQRYAVPAPKVLLINFRAPSRWLLHEDRDRRLVGKVANLDDVISPYRTISFMDLLSGRLSGEQKRVLKGSLVLVGSTSLGYFDHYPNPFTSEAPGVEYHANLIDNMLHGDFLTQLSRYWIFLIIILMVWLPMVLQRLSPAAAAAVVGGVFASWGALSYWGFCRGVRVDLIAPLAALVSAFLVQTVHRVLAEGAEKKFIKDLFGQFVAPEVVEDLARDPGKVKLGGEKREMTIFFLDIAHFTSISEKMAPEALIIFLNRYLSALSHIVHEQKGVVDKYIGDCIMAFWNAPIALKDHRARACLAAIGCQEAMNELNKSLDPAVPETPRIRIGLNSGEVTVGLTGSEKKLQYTVIGDEVNLASRLEGANKFFGSRIMASEATYGGAKDVVEARELGRVRVVGKANPIRVYELLARKGQLSADWGKALPFYEQGLAHFVKREYPQAVLAFQEFVKILPDDGGRRAA